MKVTSTPNAPAAIGPYSQAVAVNGQESFLHINHLTLQYNTFAGKAKGFSCNKSKKKL